MPTPPRCLVEIEIIATGRNTVDLKILVEEGPKPKVSISFPTTGIELKTHMLYEQLEVKLGNTLRPLINKLLIQIKENYTY